MTTTTTLAQKRVGVAAPRKSSGVVWGRVSDVWAMTRRNLVHISREPMQLSDVTIQPVLFTVLFIFIFGGGIPIPDGGNYKDFVLAGLLALNLVTSTMGTAVGLKYRPARGHNRPPSHPTDVAVSRTRGALDRRSHDVRVVCPYRGVDGARCRVAN